MKIKLIGSGAAGNKAVIRALERGIITKDKVLLVNSTSKDIPTEYQDISIIIGETNGAGKESKLGAAMMIKALEEGEELREFLPEFLEESDEAVIVVHSAEGGSGCGSAPILESFISDEVGITAHDFTFMGFETDARGLANTLNLFKQFKPEFVVHTISNKKYLDAAKGNKVLAEQMANEEFVNQLEVIMGSNLREGSQNIDDTDHFKLQNNPGYTIIETATIGRDIKTTQQLNDLLQEMIRNTKSIDIEQPTCRRFGVIWTINEDTKNIIDYGYQAIKDIVGEPYEVFDHIQEPVGDDIQTVSIVVAGLKLPIKEIQDIYDKYQDISSSVDRSEDRFYSSIANVEIEDDEFNVQTVKKSSFFGKKKSAVSSPKEQSTTAEKQIQGMLRPKEH